MRQPEGEVKRLAALRRYRIVESPPAAAFDELTALAAAFCEAPVAFIGCIDRDRIWLKARHGIDADEIGREWIDAPALSHLVTDLADDARFAAHPFVTGEPHWRFLASAPVLSDDGLPIGAMAIVDTRRRRLTEAQRATLEMLARQAAELFELHRLREARLAAQPRSAGESAPAGNDPTTLPEAMPAGLDADPALQPGAEREGGGLEAAAIRRRVLVVDDVEAAATALGRVLEAMGHETRIAHDGPRALAIAKEYHPDVILLDLGMPGMSGFVVARLLRAQSGLEGITLIAVTGHGRDEDRRQSHEAGFDHHLLKPVSAEHMRLLLDQLPPRARAEQADVQGR